MSDDTNIVVPVTTEGEVPEVVETTEEGEVSEVVETPEEGEEMLPEEVVETPAV